MSTLTDADRARIAARYPAPPMRRKLYLTLVAVLSLVLVAWLVWAGGHGASKDVEADMHSFSVVSDHEAVAEVRVQRSDPSLPAVCTLEAKALNFVRVGEVDHEIAPSAEKIVRVTIPVRTVSRAVSVDIVSCRLA